MNRVVWLVAIAAALALGFLAGRYWDGSADPVSPEDWLARVGPEFITVDEFRREMQRRSAGRPGVFAEPEQRRMLLREMMVRLALAERARALGIDREPEVRRTRDQILVNQVLQRELRPRQTGTAVADAEVRAFYEAHADDYAVPARRRVAMIFLALGPNASDETRERVRTRAEALREEALALPDDVPDFGVLARNHSEDQSSRYRGGVIGWVREEDADRYSHPEVVVRTANRMTEEGAVSPVLEDDEGLYLVRLVDYEPRRTRSLDELAAGIRQRLLRQRFVEIEDAFRDELLADAGMEVREQRLAAVPAPGPAREPEAPQPPPLPGASTGNE
jgi:hypothetical protein